MDTLLKKKEHDNKCVDIYIPTVWDSDNTGSLEIEKNIFDSLIKKSLHKYGKYTKESEILYSNINLIYSIVNKRDRCIYKYNSITTEKVNDVIVNIYDKKKLTEENFPIVNKYHDICKRNKIMFVFNNISIKLITESYSETDSRYFIEISFVNKDVDADDVDAVINNFKVNIF
jgi:hypothetical protein